MASKLIFIVTWFFLLIHKVVYYFISKSTATTQPIEIYSNRRYTEFIEYTNKKNLLLMLKEVTLYILIGGLAFLDGYKFILNLSNNEFVSVSLFLIAIVVVEFIEDVTFSLIINHNVEKEYRYNYLDKKELVVKIVKDMLNSFVIMGTIFLYIICGKLYFEKFYILIVCLLSAFVLYLINRYTKVVLEKMFTLELLENEELKDEILKVAKKLEINVNKIYIVKDSKDGYGANAMCVKRGDAIDIMLFEDLIEDLTTEEIISICIHEMAHFKKLHFNNLFIFNLLKIWLLIVLFVMFDEMHLIEFTSKHHLNSCVTFFLVYEIVYDFISIFVNIIVNKFMRNYEYEADSLVISLGYTKQFESSLIYLAKENYQELTPTIYKLLVEYNHPTVIDRLENLKKHES